MNIQLNYLKSVILSQLLLETNETLQYTTQYKQSLKNRINNLNKDLESICNVEYAKVYKTDPVMTQNILNSIDELITKLCMADLDELVMINSVIDKYKENKEWFKQYGEAEFLKID